MALQVLGWFGSALLVFSLLQSRMLRLRILNTIACVLLIVFNALIAVWPMVAMNAALTVINLYFIVRMLRERDDTGAYSVLAVSEDDAYVRHFLQVQRTDIARFFPEFRAEAPRAAEDGRAGFGARRAYLVQHGHETAGIVLVRESPDGIAQVDLDYVTPAYRDFTPGKFVYRDSGLFARHGIRLVRTPPRMVDPYYDRLGFTRAGDHYELVVPGTPGAAPARQPDVSDPTPGTALPRSPHSR